MIRHTICEGKDTFEIVYNEQSTQVYIAEAQLFIKGTRNNGGMSYFIDEVEDIEYIIKSLQEISKKMQIHYEKKPKN